MIRLPELEALDRPSQLLRIPEQMDVPLTPRVTRLVDARSFRRLAGIRQLGFVSLVYPGAMHTRFEHSLGVYRNALLFLRQLLPQPDFPRQVDSRWCEQFLVAALLHDLGHWPYCHPLEDLELPEIPAHESLARRALETPEMSDLLRQDWGLTPDDVCDLLEGDDPTPAVKLARSLLSGPIDVDKLDYLTRDSLHCGVPYGRNFDASRLISSLCLNSSGDGLALSTKGRTAAELFVFARYVMFSEVYWHHAARSATAMFQRAFWELRSHLPIERLVTLSDEPFAQSMLAAGMHQPAGELCQHLFGDRRQLYKRWGQFSCFADREIFVQLARQPFAKLVQVAAAVAAVLNRRWGTPVTPLDVLLDAPPPGLEVQFAIQVRDLKTETCRPLGQLSPVVQALAEVQFDDYVKQVRLFLHPRLTEFAKELQPEPILREAIGAVDF